MGGRTGQEQLSLSIVIDHQDASLHEVGVVSLADDLLPDSAHVTVVGVERREQRRAVLDAAVLQGDGQVGLGSAFRAALEDVGLHTRQEVSQERIRPGEVLVAPLDHLLWGMPAGFMIAALVWMLPRIESAGEVLMITFVTYMIGLGGFSHVVAGSTELFIVVLLGEMSVVDAILGGTLPALVGNVIGGTVIFAALAYAQVREEI